MINVILTILLYFSSILTSLWLLLQSIYYQKAKKQKTDDPILNSEEKRIDIIVAIKDENEEVIKNLVENLSELNYKNYKVIIVSDDNEEYFTKIVRYLGNIPNNFILIRRPSNEGRKAGALNFALNMSDAEMVAFLDADARVDKDFLKKLSSLNYDAVAFRIKIRDAVTHIQRAYKYATEFIMDSLFKARYNLGFLIFPNGSAFAIKRDLLTKLGGWKCGKITEDLELGIRLALNGIKIHYVNSIIVYSLAPYDLQDLYNQIRRWAYGSAELFLYSMRLFKLGAKGIEGFIYTQQWGIYPLYLFFLMLTLSLQFIIRINFIYILGSLIPVILSTIIYNIMLRAKGDYRAGIITILASMFGYIQGLFRMKFDWKVTPKKKLNSEENEVTSIKILGLVLALLSYINALFDSILSSLILLALAISFLLLQS
jgi:cellulose synthase/poly-beta-1,6-N-acetylglucosamine synthase-like glycosyltransferase